MGRAVTYGVKSMVRSKGASTGRPRSMIGVTSAPFIKAKAASPKPMPGGIIEPDFQEMAVASESKKN